MRALIQRVTEAAVAVDGEEVAHTGPGLLVLLGVEETDGDDDIEWLAGKIARLRIFDSGRSGSAGGFEPNLPSRSAKSVDNESCGDDIHPESLQAGGEALVVSQFTLHASTRKGNRPSYIRAARGEVAEPLYRKFVARLSKILSREVATGIFGAHMKVSLTGDGPVTIWMDSRNRE